MSFSSDIKSELCKCRNADCCAMAQGYGMLLFSRSFDEDDVSVTTENPDVARVFASLMNRLFGCRVVVAEQGAQRKRYKSYLSGKTERRKVMITYFNGMGCDRDTINVDKFNKSCCMSAFLRGVFLSCGTISDPEKQYRLEFVVKSNSLAVDLYGILYRKGMTPYMSTRENSVIVYIKRSEDIEDFLTTIDAPHYSLELMGVKVVKEIRNTENRRTNYEAANIAKTASASLMQCRAIEKLRNAGVLSGLPAQLRDAARLRSENPDSSLSELVTMYESEGESITRSGLNHRLSKLVQLAEELNTERSETNK